MKEAMVTKKIALKLLIRRDPKKRKITRITFSVLFLSSVFLLFFPVTKQAIANTVSNENYSIDVNTIDTNPQPTPKSQVLGVSNITTKDFTTGTNYTVNTSNDSLSIQLSQNTIDFGILSSTNPVIRTSALSLSSSAIGGQIISYENHPLSSATKDVIQDTSCDNGACSAEIAALWDNTLTYGFGYRCDSAQNTVCDPQFSTSNYFKQYPQSSQNQLPEAVIVSNKGQTQIKGSITYKVNISGTQKTGGYYNSITYLAIPNF